MNEKKFRAWDTARPLWEAIKDRVLENRNTPTRAEEVLWRELRKLKAIGLHFRRQHSIGKFIVDFYCWKVKLAVEVDGPIHGVQEEDDAKREAWLAAKGVRMLRFTNADVLSGIDSVIASILRQAEQLTR